MRAAHRPWNQARRRAFRNRDRNASGLASGQYREELQSARNGFGRSSESALLQGFSAYRGEGARGFDKRRGSFAGDRAEVKAGGLYGLFLSQRMQVAHQALQAFFHHMGV